jgi:hypothetical protein
MSQHKWRVHETWTYVFDTLSIAWKYVTRISPFPPPIFSLIYHVTGRHSCIERVERGVWDCLLQRPVQHAPSSSHTYASSDVTAQLNEPKSRSWRKASCCVIQYVKITLPSTQQIILYFYYVWRIATTCFGFCSFCYDHHQVAYNHDKKLKFKVFDSIWIECFFNC